MGKHVQASILFALASLSLSLPITIFSQLPVLPTQKFFWSLSPIPVFVFSGLSAYLVMGLAPKPTFGFFRGVVASLIVLIISSTLGNPLLVLLTVVWASWFVLPIGGLYGFMIQRYIIQSLTHPSRGTGESAL